MKRVVLQMIGVVFALYGYAQTDGSVPLVPGQSTSANTGNYRLTIDTKFCDLNGRIQSHQITDWKINHLSYLSPVDNSFRLEEVCLTEINGQERNTRKLEDLEGLNVAILNDNFTKADFYKDIPAAHVNKFRTFVQDKVGIAVPVQLYIGSLELNVPFYPSFFQNQQADFENDVSFTNQKMSVTWLGYSKINGKDCHLVQFGSMFNPFRSEDAMTATNGRSCYWVNVWILPDTQQIEYAVMYEDIVSVTKLKSDDTERQNYIQREVKYERIVPQGQK